MQNELIPYYEPGTRLTGHAAAAVTGKRFVDISDDAQSDPNSLSETSEGGNIVVSPAAAGSRALGVAAYDAAIGEKVGIVICGSCIVVPITAGAAISASDDVIVGTGGKAVPADTPAATAASLDTGVVADDNAITWTAREVGPEGDDITVAMVFTDDNVSPIEVDVDGHDIVVTLESTAVGAGTIVSTADDVKAAVAEHDTASQLVTVEDKGASDGSGVVTAVAETNLAGGSDASAGKVVGKALTGALNNTDAMVQLSR